MPKPKKPSSKKPKSKKSLTPAGLNRNTKTYKAFIKERRRVQNLAQKRKSRYGEEIDINALFGNIPSTYQEMRRATREMRRYHTGESLSNLQSEQVTDQYRSAIEQAKQIRERTTREQEPPVSENTPTRQQPPAPLPPPPAPPDDIPTYADISVQNMRETLDNGAGTNLPLNDNMQDYYNVGTVGELVNLALDTLIGVVGKDLVAAAYQQELQREQEYMERYESRYDQYFSTNFLRGIVNYISANGEGIDISNVAKMLDDAQLVLDENTMEAMDEAAEMERETFFHYR